MIPLKNQTWGNSPTNNVEDFDGPRQITQAVLDEPSCK